MLYSTFHWDHFRQICENNSKHTPNITTRVIFYVESNQKYNMADLICRIYFQYSLIYLMMLFDIPLGSF